jgi:hypothetical protein
MTKDQLRRQIVVTTIIAVIVSAIIFIGFYPKGSAGLMLTAMTTFLNVVMGFLNYRRYTRAPRQSGQGKGPTAR